MLHTRARTAKHLAGITFHGKNRKKLNAKILSLIHSIAALTVRYLTRRFIGEYRSKTDLLYRQTISLDSGLLDVEIVDVSHESDNDFPIEQIQWADACLIVYSITDRESFQYTTRTLANMKSLQNNPSAYLIANKSDLDHLREVSFAIFGSSYENTCIRSGPTVVDAPKHFLDQSQRIWQIVRLPTNGRLNKWHYYYCVRMHACIRHTAFIQQNYDIHSKQVTNGNANCNLQTCAADPPKSMHI